MWKWFKKSAERKEQDARQRLREELLAEINAVVPPGVDWRAGALRYISAENARRGEDFVTRYMLSKPFAPVPPPAEGAPRVGGAALIENCAYLSNFLNVVSLLDLPGGSRVLDVACGPAWVTHFLSRMGYETHGFDISDEMITIGRRRLREDPLLENLSESLDERLFVLDIEREPLPSNLHGRFDAIILESCLHHFLDPITALEHLAAGLSPDGLIVLIEGENRSGPLRPEYLSVMREFDTLERPYSRSELERVLHFVGLNHREFYGRMNGWFSPRDPRVAAMPEIILGDAAALNFAVVARNEAALQRIAPFRSQLQTSAE